MEIECAYKDGHHWPSRSFGVLSPKIPSEQKIPWNCLELLMIGMRISIMVAMQQNPPETERYARYPESRFQPCDAAVLYLSSKQTAPNNMCSYSTLPSFKLSRQFLNDSPVQMSVLVICSERCWFNPQVLLSKSK